VQSSSSCPSTDEDDRVVLVGGVRGRWPGRPSRGGTDPHRCCDLGAGYLAQQRTAGRQPGRCARGDSAPRVKPVTPAVDGAAWLAVTEVPRQHRDRGRRHVREVGDDNVEGALQGRRQPVEPVALVRLEPEGGTVGQRVRDRSRVDIGGMHAPAGVPVCQGGSDRPATTAEVEGGHRVRAGMAPVGGGDEGLGAMPRDERRRADAYAHSRELREPDDVLQRRAMGPFAHHLVPPVGVASAGEDDIGLPLGEDATGAAKHPHGVVVRRHLGHCHRLGRCAVSCSGHATKAGPAAFRDNGAMAAQYGPHRWSAGYHDDGNNAAFRGATFMVADLAGARFVDCDMTGVKIIDAALIGVDVSGYVDRLVVNGVDVTAFVDAELDRRHPERVQLREMRTADDYRAMWDTVERLWSGTVARAERLPEPALHERVAEEWSFVETLRHLVYIADAWASRTVLDEPRPYHTLGLPQTAYAPADAAELGMDLDARPSYADVLTARVERMALIRDIVDGLTGAELERMCTRAPVPGFPEGLRSVAECLGVVMEEECDHHRFAVRDLAALEAR